MKLGRKGLVNEKRKILPSKESGAGGVLARTTGGALPNQHSPMVAGWRGLLCRHFGGVRIMNFNTVEIQTILSALESDTLGKWGDGRQEKIDKLVAKLKRERVSK